MSVLIVQAVAVAIWGFCGGAMCWPRWVRAGLIRADERVGVWLYLYWGLLWPVALLHVLVAPRGWRGWRAAFWTAVAAVRHHLIGLHGQEAFCAWCARCEHGELVRRRCDRCMAWQEALWREASRGS